MEYYNYDDTCNLNQLESKFVPINTVLWAYLKFVDNYVNVYYREALKELALTPINQGHITKVDFKENNNLEFEIEFEVRPDIKLPKYKKKVTIKTNKYLAGDKDLEDSIKDLQTRFASSKTVEGEVSSGYFIYADLSKKNKIKLANRYNLATTKYLPGDENKVGLWFSISP